MVHKNAEKNTQKFGLSTSFLVILFFYLLQFSWFLMSVMLLTVWDKICHFECRIATQLTWSYSPCMLLSDLMPFLSFFLFFLLGVVWLNFAVWYTNLEGLKQSPFVLLRCTKFIWSHACVLWIWSFIWCVCTKSVLHSCEIGSIGHCNSIMLNAASV